MYTYVPAKLRPGRFARPLSHSRLQSASNSCMHTFPENNGLFTAVWHVTLCTWTQSWGTHLKLVVKTSGDNPLVLSLHSFI